MRPSPTFEAQEMAHTLARDARFYRIMSRASKRAGLGYEAMVLDAEAQDMERRAKSICRRLPAVIL